MRVIVLKTNKILPKTSKKPEPALQSKLKPVQHVKILQNLRLLNPNHHNLPYQLGQNPRWLYALTL
jgi:hypothetical protein